MASANVEFRDFNTDGVPSSGKYKPKKAGIRNLFKEISESVEMGLVGGMPIYETRALVYAASAQPLGVKSVWVTNDPTLSFNGIYAYLGGTGAGAFRYIGDKFRFDIVNASGVAGSANAITAVTDNPVSDGTIVSFKPVTTNTGSTTVSFNGGSPLTIKKTTGNDVGAGNITLNMSLLGVVRTPNFELYSDIASQSIVAQAEAAATEASLYDGPKVDTFAQLATVTPVMLAVGGFIRCIDTNTVYQRVATGGHLNYSGIGGIRLNALISPPSMGFSPMQFGAVGDGLADDTVPVRAAADAAKTLGVGLYHHDDEPFRITDNKGIWFGSNDCLTWVRRAEITLIADFNGGVLYDLTGIGNGGRNHFRLKGSVAAGRTPSYGVVQARPKQSAGVRSSGNAAELYINISGSFLAAVYGSVASESNRNVGSLLNNIDGVAGAWLRDDYFKNTFRLPITSPSAAFAPGGVLTGSTSGATATILRTESTNSRLFLRALTGTFVNGETVTGSISASTATANIPTGYIVTGPLSPNTALGIEETSTSVLQAIDRLWANNQGGNLFPTILCRTFTDLSFTMPNVTATSTADLFELHGNIAGVSIIEAYLHSTHRNSIVLGDAAQLTGNQIIDGLSIVAPKNAGNPTARIKTATNLVQLNNCNIDIGGAIDLGGATLGANSFIRLRHTSGNPASFTASGPLAGLIHIDKNAVVNITSVINNQRHTIHQVDTGLWSHPLRPAPAVGIVSDAITLTQGPLVVVDTEGLAATDTLSTINIPAMGAHGMVIYLKTLSGARDVTVSITGGNIRGPADVVLSTNSITCTLIYDANAALWYIV